MKRLFIWLALLAGLALASCEKEQLQFDQRNEVVKLSSSNEEVGFSNEGRVATVSFGPLGGKVFISVATTYEWELETEENMLQWCGIVKTETGVQLESGSLFEDGKREGTVKLISKGNSVAYIKVSQTGVGKEPSIFLENDRLEFYDNGGEKDLQVLTNLDAWEVAGIEAENDGPVEWLSAEKDESGRFFRLSVTKNETETGREADVVIKGYTGDNLIYDTLSVSQWEASMLLEVVLDESDDNLKVILPFKGEVDLTVAWDDTKTEYFNYARNIDASSSYLSYTYSSPGKYYIRIKGKAESMSTETYEHDQWAAFLADKYIKPIKALKQWGNLGIKNLRSAFAFTGIESVVTPPEGMFESVESVRWMFWSSSLKSIPDDFFYGMPSLSTAQGVFWECSALESVNEDLFSKCAGLVNASYAFAGCTSLAGIPEGIFSSNVNLEDVSYAFSDTDISEIPAGVLDNNPKLKNVSGLLKGCGSIESVPEDLFSNNANIENASSLFQQCRSLKSVPENIFSGLPALNDVSYMFSECLAMESTPQNIFGGNPEILAAEELFSKNPQLKTVSAEIFSGMTKVESLRGAFLMCSGIEGVPDGLFSNCTSAMNFESVFSDCSSLANLPSRLFPESVDDLGNAFKECTSLETVPEGIFDNLSKAVYMNYIFQNCDKLKSIPAGLFEDCSSCEAYAYTFYGCTALESLPERLFNGTSAILGYFAFENTFGKCTALKSIPADLFSTCTKTAGICNTFIGCESLEAVPEGLLDNCTELTDVSGLFYGCSGIKTIPVNLFDNCKKIVQFGNTFRDCSSVQGESPYTEVNGTKIHIYERGEGNDFAKPWGKMYTFYGSSFSDLENIPSEWK